MACMLHATDNDDARGTMNAIGKLQGRRRVALRSFTMRRSSHAVRYELCTRHHDGEPRVGYSGLMEIDKSSQLRSSEKNLRE